MEFIKRMIYIYCKECNNDIVEVPNCSGLCKQCNIKNNERINEKIEEKINERNNEIQLLASFLGECSNEKKNELFAILMLNNGFKRKMQEDLCFWDGFKKTQQKRKVGS